MAPYHAAWSDPLENTKTHLAVLWVVWVVREALLLTAFFALLASGKADAYIGAAGTILAATITATASIAIAVATVKAAQQTKIAAQERSDIISELVITRQLLEQKRTATRESDGDSEVVVIEHKPDPNAIRESQKPKR